MNFNFGSQSISLLLSNEEGNKCLNERKRNETLTGQLQAQNQNLPLDLAAKEKRTPQEANALVLATWEADDKYSLSLQSEEKSQDAEMEIGMYRRAYKLCVSLSRHAVGFVI